MLFLLVADIPIDLLVIMPLSLIVNLPQFNCTLSAAIVIAVGVEQTKFESSVVEDKIFDPQGTCAAIASGAILTNIKAAKNTNPQILTPFFNIQYILIIYINFYVIE